MVRFQPLTTAWATALALAVGGCQTTTVQSIPTTPGVESALPEPLPEPRPDVTTFTGTGSATDRRVTADEAVTANAADASAARLHDIEGTLLMYCALHRRMPARLEDLRPLADADVDLQLTAPSGQPYLYAPDGLLAPGATRRIVVADPAPSRAGSRWCILMPPTPLGGRGPASMEVVAVPEAAFKQYVPAE